MRSQRSSLPAGVVLGTGEAPKTELDQLRLVSIGARLTGFGDELRQAEVYLADPDTATVLILRKEWSYKQDEEAPNGVDLGRRNVASGVKLGVLARGQVVTQVASRLANRRLVIGRSRGARTSVTPQSGDWGNLPVPIRVDDLDVLVEHWRSRPPRLLRPRLLAEAAHVLPVAEVEEVAWSPGEQAVVAWLAHPTGGGVRLILRHRTVAPGATAATARALTSGKLRFVSGELHRTAFGFDVEPLALVTDRVVVPDLEATGEGVDLPLGSGELPTTPISVAVEEAMACLEEGAHHGLAAAPSSWTRRLTRCADRLEGVGLRSTASVVRRLAEAETKALSSGRDAAPEAADAWFESMIRLGVTREAAELGG